MKVEIYIGCLLCGIKEERSLKPTCQEESKIWGIHLVPQIQTQKHIWVEIKEVTNSLGFGDLEYE